MKPRGGSKKSKNLQPPDNGMPFVPSKISPIKEEEKPNVSSLTIDANNGEEKKEIDEPQGSVSPLIDTAPEEDTKKSIENANLNSKKNGITKQYYNGSKNREIEEDTTMTLTYYMELQSRLQHLESLTTTDIDQDRINDYIPAEETKENKSKDMITEIHENNMKMIESIIQNVIYDKSAKNIKEEEKDFYNRLNSDDVPNGNGLGKGKGYKNGFVNTKYDANAVNNNNNNNWSQPQRKRRPSVDRQVLQKVDLSLGYVMGKGKEMMSDQNAIGLVTSAAILYSCGVLFYCIENDVYVSLFAYLFGIILIGIVIIIGALFANSSLNRNTNDFFIAVALSVVMIYISIYWISYYYNTTSAFILIMAVLLSYSYKQPPIYAKQRNLDELLICLILNVGLPLFAYYMQLPEIQNLNQLQQIQQQQQQIVNDNVNIMETTVNADEIINDTIQQEVVYDSMENEEDQGWFVYLLNLTWNLFSMILTDFWNMLDITYALDEEDLIQQQQKIIEQEMQEMQQQQIQQQQDLPPIFDESTLKEEVIFDSTKGGNTGSSVLGSMFGSGSGSEATTATSTTIIDDVEVDGTLYWFNKLFYIFPVTLFNVILISWFITHSTMLIRNVSQYKAANSKILYCMEVILAHILSIIFWYNNIFDITLFYWMILTIPWTLGLLKYIYEHKNIINEAEIASYHVSMYNLWFFIAMYLSLVYNMVSATGIIWMFFSPNLLILAAPFVFIIQCMDQIIKEFVWATDF